MDVKQAAKALQVVLDKAVDSGILSRSAVEKGGASALSAMNVISKVRIPILSTVLTQVIETGGMYYVHKG